MDQPRWKHRPAGSNWGDFGPDDQRGRLNLITTEKVLQGIREVRDGRSFCLSLPLDYPGGNAINPRRFPPVIRPTLRGKVPNSNYQLHADQPGATDVINDDLVVLHTHYSTQWDALSHIGQMFDADGDGAPEPVFYNGFRAGEDVRGSSSAADAGAFGTISPHSTSNAARLGIDVMAETCVQGRAVMIDLHAHFGDIAKIVSYDDLRRVMEADGAIVETGDMVCLHTGYAELLLGMDKSPDTGRLATACALDGRDERLLEWITDSGLSVLVADNVAVEVMPATSACRCSAALPLHEHCLFKLGIHLGEFWHLTPLARYLRAQGRSRFLLTAPPIRLPGAVGAPTCPVGTV